MRALQSAVRSAWRTHEECSRDLELDSNPNAHTLASLPPRSPRNDLPFLHSATDTNTSLDTLTLSPKKRMLQPKVAIRNPNDSHTFSIVPLRDSTVTSFLDTSPSFRSSTSSSYSSYSFADETLGKFSTGLILSPALLPSRSRDDTTISPLALDASQSFSPRGYDSTKKSSPMRKRSGSTFIRAETPTVPAIQLHPVSGIAPRLASRMEGFEKAVVATSKNRNQVPQLYRSEVLAKDRDARTPSPSHGNGFFLEVPARVNSRRHALRDPITRDRYLDIVQADHAHNPSLSSSRSCPPPARTQKHHSSPASPVSRTKSDSPSSYRRNDDPAKISSPVFGSAKGAPLWTLDLISLPEAAARQAAERDREAWTSPPSPSLSAASDCGTAGSSAEDNDGRHASFSVKERRSRKLHKSLDPRQLLSKRSSPSFKDKVLARFSPSPPLPPPSPCTPPPVNLPAKPPVPTTPTHTRQPRSLDSSRLLSKPFAPSPMTEHDRPQQQPQHPFAAFMQPGHLAKSPSAAPASAATTAELAFVARKEEEARAAAIEIGMRSAPPTSMGHYSQSGRRYPLESLDPNVRRSPSPREQLLHPKFAPKHSSLHPNSSSNVSHPSADHFYATPHRSLGNVSPGGGQYVTRPLTLTFSTARKSNIEQANFVLGAPAQSALAQSRTRARATSKTVHAGVGMTGGAGTTHHHPIVSDLLRELDVAINEWSVLAVR